MAVATRCSENCAFKNGKLGQIETHNALPLYQVQLVSAKIDLKVLGSEDIGAFMKKEVKFSLFDNWWLATYKLLLVIVTTNMMYNIIR